MLVDCPSPESCETSDCVIEKKFHVCKLCGKEVLKDNRLIYFHNVSAHKANKGGTKKQHKPADSSVGGVVNIVDVGVN